MSVDVKQVILMRKDLNMRKGKMVAQGAHASMKFLSEYATNEDGNLTEEQFFWLTGLFTKVCLGVNSETELLELVYDADQAGLSTSLITDSGLTEFHGKPTITCAAIGPNWSEHIDRITGHLTLL